METLKTLILRSKSAKSIGFDPENPFGNEQLVARALEPSGTNDEITIDVDELTPAQIDEVAKEENVVTTLPSMPFSLIEPENFSAGEKGSNWGITSIGADGLDESAGEGMTVAVLDTGIEKNHEAFQGMNVVPKNFVNGEPDKDVNGHGTHCAGTIFGQDVQGTRIGVARGVSKVLAGKVLGKHGGDSEAIYKAIMWAASETANVISMSLGMDFTKLREDLLSRGYNDLAATDVALSIYARNLNLFQGVAEGFTKGGGLTSTPLIIAAAGNESRRPSYTIETAPPASAADILSVGAVDATGAVASFSNTNPDLAAPGVGVLSAKLGGGLIGHSGTSMATPHVAGLAAVLGAELLKAGKPVNPASLMFELKRRARKLAGSHVSVGLGMAQL